MRLPMNTNEHRRKIFRKSVALCGHLWIIVFAVFLTACSELEKPQPAPFYADAAPPPKKEFRWSNGKTPKSFDPAKAAAPPETDVVRAVYEGLTEIDPQTLKPIPAIAKDWDASDDLKTWTFNLRENAKWSNGETVTANDFVRSWKRLAALGDNIAHRELTTNIVGFQIEKAELSSIIGRETLTILPKLPLNNNELLPFQKLPVNQNQANTNSSNAPIAPKTGEINSNSEVKNPPIKSAPVKPFGVEAVDNFTLRVTLKTPDKDFPSLAADAIFRPIYGDGKNYIGDHLNAGVVTNGAFRIASVGQDGITLDRAENYWSRATVELERVKMVPTENAEKALAAYRAGEIDAVTNADFEPLALKLLATYDDFERTPHAAINFYEYNQKRAPFNDLRVREALAIAIERERLTEDEMDGASKPALNFLPFGDDANQLEPDAERAKSLLADSGFPGGADFPAVRLLVNRNNIQQKIARAVARMWKKNLNIETEITVEDADNLEAAWATGEYDLRRRGVVLPTTDETAGMQAIFTAPPLSAEQPKIASAAEFAASDENSMLPTAENSADKKASETPSSAAKIAAAPITTDRQAVEQLPAIPLYFPTSYSLVKPYIKGFDVNILDAPLLRTVRIDNDWQPQNPKDES